MCTPQAEKRVNGERGGGRKGRDRGVGESEAGLGGWGGMGWGVEKERVGGGRNFR